MIHKYELSELAISDLNEIWLYTFVKWSESQADSYYNKILEEVKILCSTPNIGKIARKENELRIWPVNAHIIVYRIEDEILRVIRILHKRMNFLEQEGI